MIYLKLFLTFLEIGAISFGGGYAMISFISEKTVSNGWLTEEELLNMIAVSESTPGPIAVNMATFVGSTQGGMLGSLLATLGVVLPSFIIILIISALLKRFLQYKSVSSFLKGVRPAVVGLILATAFTMLLSSFFDYKNISSRICVDLKACAVLLIITSISVIYKKLAKKKLTPIKMIIISAILGIAVWGI